ncbi:MAG: hypothetical protein FJW79_01160 [Actinobacteria bacterium]|nr:hypothetical protein [Actinomycetota bacterium]
MARARVAALLTVTLLCAACSPQAAPPSSGPPGPGPLPTAEEARITAILPFGGAGAWVGTFDGTLAILGASAVPVEPPDDPAWGSVRALVFEDEDLIAAAGTGLFRLGNDGWEALDPAGGGVVSTSITVGPEGIWVGRADPATGLGSLGRAGGEAWPLRDHTTVIPSASMVLKVVADDDGSVWAATNGAGVVRRSAEGIWSLHGLATGALRSDLMLDLAADPLGGVWAASAAGVSHLTKAGYEAAPAHVLPGPLAATTDAVWVGSAGGRVVMLERAARTWWVVRGEAPGQAAVTAIVVASDGTAWVGTDGDGVLRFSSAGVPLPGFLEGDAHVTALVAAGDVVWAGTRGGVAYRLIGHGHAVASTRFPVVAAVGPSPAPSEDRVEIPSGWFLMGSDQHRPDEAPQRRVYLGTFRIGRYEVTNRQYDEYATAAGLAGAASWPGLDPMLGRGAHPVAGVRWEEAAAYCAWAGGRLPTEAEWEKAARGTDGRTWPWGDEWDPARANTAAAGLGGPVDVGSFSGGVSPYRIADMAGNLEEWVADYYQADYYSVAPDRNPTGPVTVVNHVRRGGSWAGDADQARTSYRTSSHGSSPDFRAGFRCAWDP